VVHSAPHETHMDDKTLHTLEYDKILERMAAYAAFAASRDKILALRPTRNIDEALRRQAETTEAVQLLLTRPDLTIGGARDIRAAVDLARHGGVLPPSDLLDVKSTLIAARNLTRVFEKLAKQFPRLSDLASQMPSPPGLVEAITRVLSDRGEILDSASPKLANIRHDVRIAYDRLMSKMQRMVTDPRNGPFLQEAIITQRDGRYVLPLRAEFKGRIKSVVHDQSASGATLFVEPLVTVELNNKYRELQLAERDEERRILAELSAEIGMSAELILHIVHVVAELDFIFVRAKFSDDLKANEPKLIPIGKPREIGQIKTVEAQPAAPAGDTHTPEGDTHTPAQAERIVTIRHPGTSIRLYQARHPLLDAATVVPVDVDLDTQTFALVVTGPNTGGKTVALKTVGLLALMAQSGLHIPADSGSELTLFNDIYADIGDEQSIEQSLSTFSGHVTNIIRILEHADRTSLVILDELGAGTDPQEGAALARALLSHLLERGITTLVTTHHPELKAYAHATPGVVNASVEFDLNTLRPTFHLTIGLPGRSNALAIAQRLGMPTTIIEDARTELHPDDLRAESMLDEIHRQRDSARKARGAADRAKFESEKMRGELTQRLDKIENERHAILEKARAEAEAKIQKLEEEMKETRRQLARARQPLDVVQAVEEKVESLQETVEQEAYTPVVERRAAPMPGDRYLRRSVQLGDKVHLKSLNTKGIVTALSEEEAEVQVGMLRIRARLTDLQPVSPAAEPANEPGAKTPRADETTPGRGQATAMTTLVESPGIELDLRGQTTEEALEKLERYLDSAYLAGLPWVRIIHGKGTGKLRQAVRQALNGHPQVKSFELGGDKEGGDGVTVAKLMSP
jgi:DNA mismatch repair protein MutS2